MKKTTTILALAASFFLLTGEAFAQTGKAALTGVWKYEWEGWDGIAILSPTHFIWVISAKSRQPFTTSAPSTQEKAKAYDALLAGAGTWDLVSEKRAKATFLWNVSPEAKTAPPTWDFELKGTSMISRIIQPDGTIGETIRCRKLAGWNTKSEIAMLNGVWEYGGQNGLYLQSGNYGAWLLVNGAQKPSVSDEAKAQNFDLVNCAVAVATRVNGNRHAWNIIHSTDARREKETYYTDCTMPNPGFCKMWVIDAMGNKVGEEWQVKRIAQ